MTNDEYNYERIAKAIQFISENAKHQPSLEAVAAEVHLSPFHFQRLFTEWAGVSPKKFLQYLTTGYLKETIASTSNLSEAAEMAGLSSQSRVYDLFTGIEAVTPNEYKNGGKNLTIYYGYHPTPFGRCFIAVTERGICSMAFTENETQSVIFNSFINKWHFAQVKQDQLLTKEFIKNIFSPSDNSKAELKILVQGTGFQIKVWEALLNIPQGKLVTYKDIAQNIKNSKAVRAVGTAIGDNPIAYLIPCHRVIRKEGKIGEYRWGSTRKKAIIGWEASQTEQ